MMFTLAETDLMLSSLHMTLVQYGIYPDTYPRKAALKQLIIKVTEEWTKLAYEEYYCCMMCHGQIDVALPYDKWMRLPA